MLKDVDYLASLAKVAPEEADSMLAGWGLTRLVRVDLQLKA